MSAGLAPVKIPTSYALYYAEQQRRRDPLKLFRFKSEAQRKLVRYVRDGYETLFRAGNSSGKTSCGAAIAVSLLRGKKDLAGEPLPEVPSPCIGWCVVQTYKGQVDGAQAAVLQWLGDWPHKIVYGISEAKGWIDTLWIATDACKHGMGEKCGKCSKLVFHCAESDSNIGGRVHFVWADEPPKKEVWDECRQRSTAKHLLVRYITATPKEKQWWWWMPADFHDCEDKPREGYVEIRSSMMDNKALSPAVLKQKLSGASKDQRARSVIYGDYIDLKGECPFPPDKLEVWLARCKPPKVHDVVIEAVQRDGGDDTVMVRCKVEVFADYDPEESYICTIDPATFLRLHPTTGFVATDWTREGSSARGVPDPCGMHIYARRKPMLAVRFSGYCGAHGLGNLAVKKCREYGNALIDTDLTGGHGEPTIRAILKTGYRNVNSYNAMATSPTSHTQRLGFTMTGAVRAQMISAIQQALMDDSVVVQSEAAVRSLMAVTYVITAGGNERPEASYGAKDEDMICLGRFLHLTTATPLPKSRTVRTEDAIGKMLGRPLVRRITAPKGRVMWTPGRR